MNSFPVGDAGDALADAVSVVDDVVDEAVTAVDAGGDAVAAMDEVVDGAAAAVAAGGDAVEAVEDALQVATTGAAAVPGSVLFEEFQPAVTPVDDTSEAPGATSPVDGVLPATPLERVEAVSYLLDESVPIPGTDVRVGLDPILGILPVAGDSVAAAISLYIVLEGALAGVPPSKVALMLGLVGVDAAVGSVPILGSVFDTVWRANTWNASIVRSELASEPTR